MRSEAAEIGEWGTNLCVGFQCRLWDAASPWNPVASRLERQNANAVGSWVRLGTVTGPCRDPGCAAAKQVFFVMPGPLGLSQTNPIISSVVLLKQKYSSLQPLFVR